MQKKELEIWTKTASFWYQQAAILKNYCHKWNQHCRYFNNAKFCTKIKILKFGIKNALFRYFEKLLPYLISELSKRSKCKELCKNKNPYIWNQKKPYLGIFKLQLEKAIVIFEISTLKFPCKQIFVQKKRDFKCETKSQIPCLGIFGLQFWKAVVTFGINTPEIVKMRSFEQK